MTKIQLVDTVASKTSQPKAQVEAVLDSVLEAIAETLQTNQRVDLRGFGAFTLKHRNARQGRNPQTGESITISAKAAATFKPGKELSQRLAAIPTPTPAPKTLSKPS